MWMMSLKLKMANSPRASVESWLMVDDALGTAPEEGPDTELRDGVAIDAKTRTVEEDERGGHKFDMELLAAGTSFDLEFEFWRTADNEPLLQALVSALTGFEEGRITMGETQIPRIWQMPCGRLAGVAI